MTPSLKHGLVGNQVFVTENCVSFGYFYFALYHIL